MYRIIQESLTNVARHARVNQVTVRLVARGSALGSRIEDRGVGFDPRDKSSAATSCGLVGMRERAELLGGSLAVWSRPGAGACVSADLPLAGQVQERRSAAER